MKFEHFTRVEDKHWFDKGTVTDAFVNAHGAALVRTRKRNWVLLPRAGGASSMDGAEAMDWLLAAGYTVDVPECFPEFEL